MFFVIWAKPLRLWVIALFLFPFVMFLTMSLGFDRARFATLGWRTPAYGQLQQVEGELLPAHLRIRGKTVDSWGQARLDDGSLFRFTCEPGVADSSCAYVAYRPQVNVGRRLTFRYFDWPIPDEPAHVVMSMEGVGRYSWIKALAYAESVQRIEEYRAAARWPDGTTLALGGLLLLLIPGLVWRLIAGRDPDPPKDAKARVELSGV